jgi:DNA-directed RNA polymerase I and III subunit RPAC2
VFWREGHDQLTRNSDGVNVYTVLEKGLEDLMSMCDVVGEKFTASRDDFLNKMDE